LKISKILQVVSVKPLRLLLEFASFAAKENDPIRLLDS
jgi:hypothetical protein